MAFLILLLLSFRGPHPAATLKFAAVSLPGFGSDRDITVSVVGTNLDAGVFTVGDLVTDDLILSVDDLIQLLAEEMGELAKLILKEQAREVQRKK